MAIVVQQASPIRWWKDTSFLERVLGDLVIAELKKMRPGLVGMTAGRIHAGTHLIEDLGADSLELITLASALNEMVHMHEAGIEDYLLAYPTIGKWAEITQHALDTYSTTLTFRTSGSTGIPKSCDHSLAELSEEASELRQLFPDRRRILSVVPAHHIYGFLFSVLLPQASDTNPLEVVYLCGAAPAQVAQAVRDGDLIIGFPEWWNAFVRARVPISADVMGVTSTAPCSDDLSMKVLASGISHLYQVYGSSETGGIGWRSSHDSPYRLFHHWSRDETSNRLRRIGSGQFIDCQDHLAWQDSRHFRINGRTDAAVQVGGINVYPMRVREYLLQHPDVVDATVRLMDPSEGSRLKAFIVPRAGADEGSLHAELFKFAAKLSAPEQPRAYSFGIALPRSDHGKLANWQIPVLHNDATSWSS